jgi:hypothetical protein
MTKLLDAPRNYSTVPKNGWGPGDLSKIQQEVFFFEKINRSPKVFTFTASTPRNTSQHLATTTATTTLLCNLSVLQGQVIIAGRYFLIG